MWTAGSAERANARCGPRPRLFVASSGLSLSGAVRPLGYTIVNHRRQETAAQRAARVAEIRRQIATGEYETSERMSQAVDALLERLLPVDRHAGLRRRALRSEPPQI
ncbi:MAG: flagellar biosynthesis anti-sigma factor FlgM [Planctomycetes bacterium]|nr:flagellar biosynthesis anti-sigma factor FlgM [Planctomycetota bacterium]